MKIMNKRSIIYSFVIAAYCFTGLSCSKFLDKKIKGLYQTNQFYTTPAAALQAVNSHDAAKKTPEHSSWCW